MKSNDYELSVKIDGNKLPEYGSHGKTYIRGESGREFTLYFKNNTPNKVLVRFSVDGLSVLDGKAAEKDTSGYICNAYSTVEINGWRTSLDEVRKFEFSSKGKSYAGKTVGKANCGVIGVQVFSEKKQLILENDTTLDWDNDWPIAEPAKPIKPLPWTQPKWPKSSPYWGAEKMSASKRSFTAGGQSSDMARYSKSLDRSSLRSESLCSCSSNEEVTDYNLGTKFGDAKKDVVKHASFEIDTLVTQMEIYYTDKAGLEKAGIETDKKVPAVAHPKAFGGFCKPPE